MCGNTTMSRSGSTGIGLNSEGFACSFPRFCRKTTMPRFAAATDLPLWLIRKDGGRCPACFNRPSGTDAPRIGLQARPVRRVHERNAANITGPRRVTAGRYRPSARCGVETPPPIAAKRACRLSACTDFGHQHLIVMQVVPCQQHGTAIISPTAHRVVQVGAAVAAAGRTGAIRRPAGVDPPAWRALRRLTWPRARVHACPGAARPRRQDAIHHVDAALDRTHDVVGLADPHQVARRVRGAASFGRVIETRRTSPPALRPPPARRWRNRRTRWRAARRPNSARNSRVEPALLDAEQGMWPGRSPNASLDRCRPPHRQPHRCRSTARMRRRAARGIRRNTSRYRCPEVSGSPSTVPASARERSRRYAT